MTPTVFREREFRFFFFSREERRMHVHVNGPGGEAKFWIEPQVELARNAGLTQLQLRQIERIIGERYDEIRTAWRGHFGR